MTEVSTIEKLEAALRAVSFHRAHTFSWFGEREPHLPARLAAALPHDSLREYLLNRLQQRLYSDFYCKGKATSIQSRSSQPILTSANAVFVNGLSAANRGHGEKELRAFSPGFYVALGNFRLSNDDNSELVRIYWNLKPEGAALLVRAVTSHFNRCGLAFRLKVANQPARFTRTDPIVLYISHHDYDEASPILEALYPRFLPFLRQGTPVFTKPVAFGTGLAEDPSPTVSFGAHRCRLVAEGMVRAHEQGKKSLPARLAMVIECFEEQELDVQRPYLNPGSNDGYDFNPRPARNRRRASPNGSAGEANATSRRAFLPVALEIGRILVLSAVWHEGRCNWMGMDLYELHSHSEGDAKLAYKALGPDLYLGAAGIALFLAELHAAAGDDEIRRTVFGAITTALAQARALLNSNSAGGLYSGLTGVTFAAQYIAVLLGEPQLSESAAELLEDILNKGQDGEHADLISGHAGTITGLLLMQQITGNSSMLDVAARLGDKLLQKAESQSGSCSWKAVNFPRQHPLTGFSHGAAGIACALLELFRATGDSRYRMYAEMAFNFERTHFDSALNNWPDFRGIPARPGRNGRRPAFPVFWCHGAAGIALSRLRAFQILGDERYRSEAVTALTTTKAWTEQMRWLDAVNFSLCHGLAGNAHILSVGARILGADFSAGHEVSKSVAIRGIELYARNSHRWPLGQLGPRTPGLMPGLSGVGYFYLALHDPGVPSPLLFELEKVAHRREPTFHSG